MNSYERVLETSSYYNAIAKGYDELYGEEQRRKYRKGLEMLEPSGKLLDIGCGTGLLIEELGDLVYFGIDVSLEMLKVAKKRGASAVVNLILADVQLMPFRSNAFKTCYSFTVLQNVPNKGAFLSEVNRICEKALISSLKGIGLECEQPVEVYPDVVCLLDHSSRK